MNQKLKSALLITLVGVNIAALGLTAGSTIFLLKSGLPARAAEESSTSAADLISAPDQDDEDDEYHYSDDDGYEERAHAEDDVVIGGQYVIRSTVQISDAYQSGDTSSLSASDQETYQMASELLDDIITADMTDYDKEKAVYDWMTLNLSFDDGMLTVISTAGNEVDCPHGVLKSHKAVCVGFATTFRLLMQMLGIECKVVHDTYLSHSWDCVKIGAHWYFVDIYSDISSRGNYAHFNLTSAMMGMDHSWDTSFFPVADSMEYNPAYQARVKIDDVYGLPAAIRSAMDDKAGYLCVEFSDSDLSEEEQSVVSRMCEAITGSFGYYYGEETDYSIPQQHCLFEDPDTGKTMLLISFYIYTEYNDDSYELPEEVEQKANDALDDAFGDLMWGISINSSAYSNDLEY